ncbi:MAG: tetratricopeptide repeat protein [Anaerolineae bacterium]|nr:tetratricopeptide repeat protein [Anaerolineae bacterium]
MLEIRLSGRFEVKLDGRAVTLPSRPAQSLFAYLALSAGTAHRREKLAGLLWPDSSDDNARRNLRQSLWHIRKALGDAAPHYLHSDDMTVTFAAVNFWLDVALLEKPTDASATPEELMAVVAVYDGELLPGFYDDWVVWQRERQQTLFERKMEQLLDRLTAVHRWDDLLEWGERWLAFGQSPEAAYRALMIAHAGRGDLARTAAVYRRCVKALAKELGVEPSPQTRALFERLAHSQDADVLAAALFPLPHQLTEEVGRDSQPQAHQPQPKWEPPDATTAVHDTLTSSPVHLAVSPPPTPSPQHNLPPQATSFIGREVEVTAVRQQLAHPATRLLTLTGTGGTGKTRLALQVAAAALPDFADGVWFVPLAAISDPTLVAATIGRQLGLHEVPGIAWEVQLIGYLQDKYLLLVLDNFEQILEAAPLLGELAMAATHLKILVTSRTHLRLAGGQEYEVSPLILPNPKQQLTAVQLSQNEAVQLYVERAKAAQAAFALTPENAADVAEICARLDGLPLALELAAARIRLISARQMRKRLNRRLQWLTGGARDAPARQQTLRATLDWSQDLLPTAVKILLRRLAVFVGGCTLGAAEAVANAQGNLDVLNGLENLLDHHLLQQQEVAGEPRFTMLETIREYALEKLAESGETEALWQQHAAFFVALAETAEPKLRGADQLTWLNRLETEQDNMRATFDWCVANGNIELGLRLLNSLRFFWVYRGQWSEGKHWANLLLAEAHEPSTTVAKGLITSSMLSIGQGDFKNGYLSGEEAIPLLREKEEFNDLALGLYFRRITTTLELNVDEYARSLLEEALTYARLGGDRWVCAFVLHGLGQLYVITHEPDIKKALGYLAEGLDLIKVIGDRPLWSLILIQIANIQRQLGNYESAGEILNEAVKVASESNLLETLSMCYGELGHLAIDHGNTDQARQWLTKSLSVPQELGAIGTEIKSLIGFARLFLATGEWRKAGLLFGFTVKQRPYSASAPITLHEFNRDLDSLRALINPDEFSALLARGEAMSLKEAIALALLKP